MTIGTVVDVRARMFRCADLDSSLRRWERHPCTPIVRGVITGKSRRHDGQYNPASGGRASPWSHYGVDDYEPASFSTTKVHTVWLVRFTLSGPEFPVHPDDLKVVADVGDWVLPKTSQPPYDARVRAALSDDARRAPRDTRGRFIKGPLMKRA